MTVKSRPKKLARLRWSAWLFGFAGVLELVAFAVDPHRMHCWPAQTCPPAPPGGATCDVIVQPGCNTYIDYVPLTLGMAFLILAVVMFALYKRNQK